jgi:parallel beta-helix repeat protein
MSGLVRRARVALLALLPLAPAAATAGNGGPTCPDRTPAAITAPAPEGEQCQKAIAKEGAEFLKTKTSTLSKCLFKSATGSCPTASDTAKIEQAALEASGKIAKACGDDAAQAGLASAYAASTDDSVVSSCTLSQHNAFADVLVLNATGISTEDWPGTDAKARSRCVSEASKRGIGVGLDLLKASAKCIDKQIKAGTAGDLAPICLGSIAAGNFVAPTDPKTASKFNKILGSADSKIAKKCGPGEGSWLPSVFACDGADTAAELANCLTCQGYQTAVDLVEQQYGEAATFVAPGPDAIDAAVDAAAPGDKLLILPGTYEDVVTIAQGDLRLVGCGGATNDRPRLVRPVNCIDPADCARGIVANGVDDLLFQSLVVEGWTNDGIFVAGIPADDMVVPPVPADPAERLTFRDIVGDGGVGDASSSRYAVFPVHSEDVLIEGCDVRDISDAGIYVGQSTDIVVRFNKIMTSVAGIEFENSARGVAHNNYATGNTGGMLVFLDGNLPVQISDDHRVTHNLFVDNNGRNYGSGNVAGVPEGTGLLLISDDDGEYAYNVITGNNSFGFALVDQVLAGFDPFSDDPEDIKATGASVHDNVVTGNGGNPDDEAPFPADMLMALTPQYPLGTPLYGDPPVHGNCFAQNLVDQEPIFLGAVSANQCP